MVRNTATVVEYALSLPLMLWYGGRLLVRGGEGRGGEGGRESRREGKEEGRRREGEEGESRREGK